MGGLAEKGSLLIDPSMRLSLQEYKTTMESLREGTSVPDGVDPEASLDSFMVKQM